MAERRLRLLLPARRADVISPHFPSEGIDYLSGNRAGIIFDMSVTNGTVALARGVEVPRPTNVASAKTSSEIEISSETSSEMTLSEVVSSISASYGDRWDMSTPVTKMLGAEVGGSRDGRVRWARSTMSASDRYAVSSRFEYDFVEVTTKPPANAVLSEDFLRAFAILPPGDWDGLTDADRRAYGLFLSTYGTHYVRAAKFGGSYESLVTAEACALVLSTEGGSSLEECAGAKLALVFDEFLGADGGVASAEACMGLTTSGSALDAWESSSVKSTQTWRGGSFDETDSMKFDDIGAWIEDVQRNPRSFPTKLASVPDLFRELRGAYGWGEEYCLPCQTLKRLNLEEERFGSLVTNLDFAFDELLVRARDEKLAEDVCLLNCGRCGEVPPSEGCACPKPSVASCSAEGADDLMEVTVASVHMEVERDWWSPLSAQNLRMHTVGLGSPYDGKEYAGEGMSISVDVGTTILRKEGDTVNIEVVDDPLMVNLKNCVGSADFPLNMIGTGKKVDMNGPCSHSNNSLNKDRVGKNPKVWIDGSVLFPNRCESSTALQISAGSGRVASGPLFLASLLAVAAIAEYFPSCKRRTS